MVDKKFEGIDDGKLCPDVNIAGNVTIEDACWIGIDTTIIEKVTIGKSSFIGAGAVFTRDIPKNTLAIKFT